MRTPRHLDLQTYILNTAPVAAGANKVMLDLYNASISDDQNRLIYIHYITIGAQSDVAVTGVVSARFDLFRTNAIGTGGTGMSYNNTDTSGINVASLNANNDSLITPPNGRTPRITARLAPSGGATASAWLTSAYVFPEETNSATILQQFVNVLPDNFPAQTFSLNPGDGLMIRQGSVLSVNNYFFSILFSVAKQ